MAIDKTGVGGIVEIREADPDIGGLRLLAIGGRDGDAGELGAGDLALPRPFPVGATEKVEDAPRAEMSISPCKDFEIAPNCRLAEPSGSWAS